MTRPQRFDREVPGLHEMMELLGDTCREDEGAVLQRAVISDKETPEMCEARVARAGKHFAKMLNAVLEWSSSEEWVMSRHEMEAMRRGFSDEDENVGRRRMRRRKKPPVAPSSRKRSKSQCDSWGGRPVWKTMERQIPR